MVRLHFSGVATPPMSDDTVLSQGPDMPRRLALLSALTLVACSNGTKASTGRTQHESDSVIANSALPGAPVAKKALDLADSSQARRAAQDSAAQSP